jgi:hypothetical protein
MFASSAIEPDSSSGQPWNALFSINSTDAGINMLFNDSQLESQDRSILSNFDPFSKIILSM